MNKELYFEGQVKSIKTQEKGITISGYANYAIFDSVDELVIPSGVDLKRAEIMPLLFNHDKDKIIGKILKTEIKSDGIWVEAYVHPLAEDEGKIITKIQEKLLNSFSIGYRVKNWEWVEDTDKLILKEIELLEVSVVSVPANYKSNIEEIKSMLKNAKDKNNKEKNNDNAKDKENNTKDKEQNGNTNNSNKDNKNNNNNKTKEYVMENLLKEMKEMITDLKNDKKVDEFNEKFTKIENELKELKDNTNIKEIIESMEKMNKEINDIKENKEITENLKTLTETIETLKNELEEVKNAKPKIEVLDADDNFIKDHIEKFKDAFMYNHLFEGDMKDSPVLRKLPERVKSVSFDSDFTTKVEKEILEDINVNMSVAKHFENFSGFDTTDDIYPFEDLPSAGFGTLSKSTISYSDKITFSLKTLIAGVEYNYAARDESILAWLPKLRKDLAVAVAEKMDETIINGSGSSGSFKGLIPYATGSSFVDYNTETSNALTSTQLRKLRAVMGKYATNPKNLIYIVNSDRYISLLSDSNLLTYDKAGAHYTLKDGVLGTVDGTPIVVTEKYAFSDTEDSSHYSALCANTKMFGYKMKNLLFERQKTITSQVFNIVLSTRVDFIPLVPLSSGALQSAHKICAVLQNSST